MYIVNVVVCSWVFIIYSLHFVFKMLSNDMKVEL